MLEEYVKKDEFVERKTGRLCPACHNTGLARGIKPMAWTEINKTEEYKNLDRSGKEHIQEKFKDDIPCPFCHRAERKAKWEKEQIKIDTEIPK